MNQRTTKANIIALACLVAALMEATTASASEVLCSRPADDQYFRTWQCPAAAEASWFSDNSRVEGGQKAQFLAWAAGMVDTIYDPSTVFQIGPELRAQLDPRFPIQLEMRAFTSEQVLRDVTQETLGILGKMLNGLAKERRSQQRAGVFNPAGEIKALVEGVESIPAPIIWARRLGSTDGYRWIALAQQDPLAALALFEGMRQLVSDL